MFDTTFNNITVISWLSALLVKDTWVCREKLRANIDVGRSSKFCVKSGSIIEESYLYHRILFSFLNSINLKSFSLIYKGCELNLICTYSSPPLIRPHLLKWKSGLIRGVASLKGDKLIVFYYLKAFEIWPGPLWLWSYGSSIYNYLCNQCLSPLKLWVWILLRRGVTQFNIKW